jgi:hypothetical protein
MNGAAAAGWRFGASVAIRMPASQLISAAEKTLNR